MWPISEGQRRIGERLARTGAVTFLVGSEEVFIDVGQECLVEESDKRPPIS
jgi:hypothetical protein